MNDLARAYLDLLRRSLLNLHYLEHEPPTRGKDAAPSAEQRLRQRREGRDWPAWAVTMVGELRLRHIEECIRTCCATGIAGDVVETGVWRGGAMIYARAVLDVMSSPRCVWLCDSFQGLPLPDPTKWPKDAGSKHFERENFKVSQAVVRGNFARFGVHTRYVEFLEGFFEDTLPGPLADRSIAVLRLDGDMYGSTMHTLRTLYDRVSPGGFIIADDWKASPREQSAIRDFWEERGLQPETTVVDWTCIHWRKETP